MIEAEFAIRLTLGLIALSILITGAEQLVISRKLDGFMDNGISVGLVSIGSLAFTRTMLAAKVLLSLACLLACGFGDFAAMRFTSPALLAVLFVIGLKRPVGGDGSDQMQVAVLLISTVCLVALPPPEASTLTAMFIGLQLIISYCTTGWAKLASPVWRQGTVLRDIVSTYSYGHPLISKILHQFPIANRLLTYFPIALFSLTPVFFIQPWDTVFLFFLLFSMIFHVMTGVMMGLNNFALTFPATFPCAFFFYQVIQRDFSGFM
jgi:hypothetical protein